MNTQQAGVDKQELFRRAWKQCRKTACGSPCGGDCSICRPHPWVVTKLLDLVASEKPETIRKLVPAIRQLIEESQFVGHSFDTLPNAKPRPPLDRQVELLVETLELLRRCESARIPREEHAQDLAQVSTEQAAITPELPGSSYLG